jgi:hypothetical protein
MTEWLTMQELGRSAKKKIKGSINVSFSPGREVGRKTGC